MPGPSCKHTQTLLGFNPCRDRQRDSHQSICLRLRLNMYSVNTAHKYSPRYYEEPAPIKALRTYANFILGDPTHGTRTSFYLHWFAFVSFKSCAFSPSTDFRVFLSGTCPFMRKKGTMFLGQPDPQLITYFSRLYLSLQQPPLSVFQASFFPLNFCAVP